MDIGRRPAAHLILLDQDRMDRMRCPANQLSDQPPPPHSPHPSNALPPPPHQRPLKSTHIVTSPLSPCLVLANKDKGVNPSRFELYLQPCVTNSFLLFHEKPAFCTTPPSLSLSLVANLSRVDRAFVYPQYIDLYNLSCKIDPQSIVDDRLYPK